ncbi:MAG: CoA-binding protein, partial [Gemmatimonadetes bacterium]|nr:CoA-binding protein [Gemmatimonadota bacterium]NIS00581.1 CoA-binding protein [Gemmatimonadota bacterium]NIT66244.1 CoA-binding protein [Gemmatimonadota bacterium]NIU54642.1 CoA-binding protein [Gemmatimonadota bacterium]NIV22808.1 CoA-binding protein [Gemmatimonadota bacterium]
EAAKEFLACKRLAVAGVSRSGKEAANIVYRKLRDSGYTVFAVNPNADEVEGDTCYPDLRSLPEPVEGVVIATHPDVTEAVVRECAELGIPRVWLHRSFGQGSVSDDAVGFCREHGITAIPGGCPMMFCEPVDLGHRCIRWILDWTGKLPKPA